jgi:hypothetical protein
MIFEGLESALLGTRRLKNPVDLMLDMQIRHQTSRMRGAISIARSIERHAPHDGAEKKRDDVNLNAHDSIKMRHIGIYVAVPSVARDQIIVGE